MGWRALRCKQRKQALGRSGKCPGGNGGPHGIDVRSSDDLESHDLAISGIDSLKTRRAGAIAEQALLHRPRAVRMPLPRRGQVLRRGGAGTGVLHRRFCRRLAATLCVQARAQRSTGLANAQRRMSLPCRTSRGQSECVGGLWRSAYHAGCIERVMRGACTAHGVFAGISAARAPPARALLVQQSA